MVRAILAGTKSQTRRIVKPQPTGSVLLRCPYMRTGRLWVRETWQSMTDPKIVQNIEDVQYRADEDDPGVTWRPSIFMPRWASRLTLEITGVRLEQLQEISATDALAEGLRYGTQLLAGAGGARFGGWNAPNEPDTMYADSGDAYGSLWNSINGRGAWDLNPWVWVIEFRKVEGGAA